MADTFEFTLDEESEKKLFELLTDVDVSKTPSFSIKDKHGNEAEYLKVVRCKECSFYTGKWCTRYSTKQCDINDICKDGNDYCSVAERKDNV